VGYHLSAMIITDHLCLPTLDLGRAVLKRSYTWHFSMQGLPANNVTIKCRELLPHVFTLPLLLPSPQSGEGLGVRLFSVALSVTDTSTSSVSIPGYSPVHCSALSGLSYPLKDESIAWLVAEFLCKRANCKNNH
jgi:hypothetical protein